MEIKEITKQLTIKKVNVSIHFNLEKNEFYIDLNTGAKSHLYLYEDGTLEGRYETKKINLNTDIESIIITLCEEFNEALCYRTYGNSYWFDLCKEMNVKLFY
jgi:hypothetical protein